MPRSSSNNSVDAALANLAQALVASLVPHIQRAQGGASHHAAPAAASGGSKRRGRPAGPSKACLVPNCSRPSAARGLCNNHYGKARKLKLNLDTLSNKDLDTLGLDGRALRWKK